MPSNLTVCAFTRRSSSATPRFTTCGERGSTWNTLSRTRSASARSSYRCLKRPGIPIIRLGLNPTDDLSGGDAAGGAYHPALGELVRSRIMLQKARELLDGITPGSTVTLAVGRGKASQMAGQHRCSTKALTEEFGLKNIRITEKTELSGQEIQILDIEMPREM